MWRINLALIAALLFLLATIFGVVSMVTGDGGWLPIVFPAIACVALFVYWVQLRNRASRGQ
ncbi:MAG: hypothetical protein Q7V58_12160 [Actinomycetota bacterium]|nr:hypothetical protein [Actinomycetota bacterium]MDP1878431.1 hypothetical protein [Actinomycetota bacterium]